MPKINPQNIRKITIEGHEYWVYFKFPNEATDEQKKEYEKLEIRDYKVIVKISQDEAEIDKLSDQLYPPLRKIGELVANTVKARARIGHHDKDYPNFYSFGSQYEITDNDSEPEDWNDETDSDDEPEQPETSSQALIRQETQLTQKWKKLADERKENEGTKLIDYKWGAERIAEEKANWEKLENSLKEKQTKNQHHLITEEENEVIKWRATEPELNKWLNLSLQSEKFQKEYAIWHNRPIITAYENAAKQYRKQSEQINRAYDNLLNSTQTLQLEEEKYKKNVNDIIASAAMENENKAQEIKTLTDRLTAADNQNKELINQSNNQEQEINERNRILAEQLTKENAKLETEQKANSRKLDDYEKMLKAAKSDKERLEIYERKLIQLTALSQDKDKQLDDKEKERKNILLQWQISHNESTAKFHRINALNREKAALLNKEIGYKGDLELANKKIQDLQTFQLKLRQDLTAAEAEHEAERLGRLEAETKVRKLNSEKKDLDEKITRLELDTGPLIARKQELENQLAKYEDGAVKKFFSFLGEKTGLTAYAKAIKYSALFVAFLVLIYLVFLLKKLFKPLIKLAQKQPEPEPPAPEVETTSEPEPVEAEPADQPPQPLEPILIDDDQSPKPKKSPKKKPPKKKKKITPAEL